MNKFGANLHSVFFWTEKYEEWEFFNSKNYREEDGSFDLWSLDQATILGDKPSWAKTLEDKTKEEKEINAKTVWDLSNLQENILTTHQKAEQQTSSRNNESLSSSKEEVEISADADLVKLMDQIAKNNIDLPWNVDSWELSRTEKKLARASARVFLQLLEKSKDGKNMVKKMVSMCKNHSWEFTEEIAAKWKSDLGINSKEKDIQCFFQSYLEYQNRQTPYNHLRELMGFFCENGIDSVDKLKNELKTRSVKITKEEIRNAWQKLYREVHRTSEYGHEYTAIIDNHTWKEISRRPKNWEVEARFMVIKDRLSANNQISRRDKMLMLLWDYDLDGEVNWWDVAYKTGTQIMEAFTRTVAMHKGIDKNFNDNKAVENLVANANQYGLNIEWVDSVEALYQWMTKWPEWYEHTRKLQEFVKNLPVELWDVLKNWENAWTESLEHITSAMQLEQQEKEAIEKAAKEKAKEIVRDSEAKLKEVIKDDGERANITQQLLSQLPWMLIDKALEQQRGLALGVSMPLDKIIKWMSAWVNVWVDSNWKRSLWIFIGWDHKFNLSDSVDLSTAISAWAKLFFIPIVAASTELWIDVNQKSRKESLDAKWQQRATLWANVTVVWWVFSRWVSAWYENNQKFWIEKNAKNINNQIMDMMSNKDNGLLKDIKNISDEKVREWLSNKFPKSSEETLSDATKNLMLIIKQFKIDEKVTSVDIEAYSRVIADVFSEQWRNDAIVGISDGKRKITGWKVWIQFFAWYAPTIAAVLRFSKIHNVHTIESEHSRARRIDANVNGTWNSRPIALENGKSLWDKEVGVINNVLKAYKAKALLRYMLEDGKPGRIFVPSSLVDSMWINVRIANTEEMRWSVRVEQDGGYSFPANTTYRLFSDTGWNQGSLVLNIGADKSDVNNDILLWDAENMKALVWDKEIMWNKTRKDKEPVSVKSLSYSGPELMKQLFTPDVIEWLKKVDSSNRRKFSEFMRTKKDGEKTFDDMVEAAINVLWKDKKYDAIKAELSIPHKDAQQKIITEVAIKKQLIMDRIMAISADANVHQKYWLEAVVNGNKEVKWRWEAYKQLKWPNGKPIFSEINVDRNALVKNIEATGTEYKPELQENLLWATAFYHKNNTAKGLAMTWLWVTTVLWWQMAEISGKDKDKVENWFLGEGEWDSRIPWVLEGKSPIERSNLKRVLSDYIKKQGINFKSDTQDGELSTNKLEDLLKWKNVELHLDNSSEIVKVKLDVRYMFYLMWECANESVGMQLWNLEIIRQEEVSEYSTGKLVFNTAEGSSRVGAKQDNVSIWVAAWLWWKNKEEPQDNPWSDPNPWNPNPWSDPNPWNPNWWNPDPWTTWWNQWLD